MTTIPPQTQAILDALTKVTAETLERKRRLGHYVVIWRNGRPLTIGEDAPSDFPAQSSDAVPHQEE